VVRLPAGVTSLSISSCTSLHRCIALRKVTVRYGTRCIPLHTPLHTPAYPWVCAAYPGVCAAYPGVCRALPRSP
jgi:hypothetical protein